MKNKMSDLNNHLFAALERLNDEDLTPEQIETEVSRSAAMTKVADTIIESANTSIRAARMVGDYGDRLPIVPMLGFNKDS